jgi:predicted 3-demethylubiquinone-9 3-methyltransferase (glyoxalase superfamily)
MQSITPFLWFDTQAEEAANFYVALFPDSEILSVSHMQDGRPGHEDESTAIVSFKLRGQEFQAISAGPIYQFNPAISFVIDCITQDEVDHDWDGLLADGGEPVQCGWLIDKFGLSWQVVPRRLQELMSSSEPEVAKRVTQAMLKMIKLDIAELEAAARG